MKLGCFLATLLLSSSAAFAEGVPKRWELGVGAGTPFGSILGVYGGARVIPAISLELRAGTNLKQDIYSLGASWHPQLNVFVEPFVGGQVIVARAPDTGGPVQFHSALHFGVEKSWQSGITIALGVEPYMFFQSELSDSIVPHLFLKYRF